MTSKQMNPKVMDAVGFIGRYVADHWESIVDQDEICDELTNLGFSNTEITDAFRWIERNTLGSDEGTFEDGATSDHTAGIRPPVRVLTAIEQSKISSDAYGVLMGYYNRGLIEPVLLEEIIERALQSESEEIGGTEIRRITSLTLFNKVQAEWREYLRTTNTLVH